MTTTFHEKVEVRRAQSLISGITRAKFSVIQIQIVSFLRDDFPNRLGNQARIWKTKVLVQLRTRNKFACLHGLGMHFGIVVNPNPKPFLTILIILLNSSAEPCQGKPQKLECTPLGLRSVLTMRPPVSPGTKFCTRLRSILQGFLYPFLLFYPVFLLLLHRLSTLQWQLKAKKYTMRA